MGAKAIRALLPIFPAFLAVLGAGSIYAQQPAASGATAPPADTSAKAPASGNQTPAVVAQGDAAETLLGKPVRSAKGEDLGRVVDVIVDRNGMVQAAIIDFGGFLGVGTRKIAVDWHILHFPDGGALDKLTADLPKDRLQNAPAYKEGEPIVIMGRTAPAAPTAPNLVQTAPAQQLTPKP